MARYEFSDGKSHKFWEITRDGVHVTTRWGRIGTDGQTKTKSHADEAAADKDMAKQIKGKTRKGYVLEGTAAATPAATAPAPIPPGKTDLVDGESIEVPGSGGRTYTLTNTGGVYSCTCPAWRNQSRPIDARTCKHLRRFRGDAAEEARLGALPEPAARASTTEAPVLLANSWDPAVHDPTGWWMSEKLDGVRALWTGSGFVSRQGKPFHAPDWFVATLPAHPLDGELFVDRGLFHRTVSIVRRVDGGEAWRQVRYMVFDAPEQDGDFEARLAHLEGLSGGWDDHVVLLDHRPCVGTDDLNAELARIEGLGGEGLMLRKPGSRYVAGRSDTLLKVKTFVDAEARVTGHVAGAGRHKGRLGAVRAELPNGTAFKVGTGFSDAEREDPPAIGTVITFRYQELTRAGVPRFPTFVRVRTDVTWEEVVAQARR